MDALDITLRIVAVLLAFLVLPLLVGQTEHKVMAHMQGRVGPMYAGASTAGPNSSPTASSSPRKRTSSPTARTAASSSSPRRWR